MPTDPIDDDIDDRQQAINWNNVDSDLCHYMASLGHNELTIDGFVQDWSNCSMLAIEILQSCVMPAPRASLVH